MAKSVQLEKVLQAFRDMGSRSPRDVHDSREILEQALSRFPPASDIICQPVSAGGVPAEWVSAPGADPSRVVLYFHGGGYTRGSARAWRDLTSRLARASGSRVLVVDYRLAPEHRFPAAVEDAVNSYRWLVAQGVAPGRIVVAADSSGGGLALALMLSLRDAGEPLPAGTALLSPFVDLECTGETMTTKAEVDPVVQREPILSRARMYLGDADPRDPLASPLYADLRGLPPLLVHVGSSETLLDDSKRIAEKARTAGVDVTLEVWDDMVHEWQIFSAILLEGQQSLERIGRFVRERTGAARVAPPPARFA
jgi:acetyl esterase/lipase